MQRNIITFKNATYPVELESEKNQAYSYAIRTRIDL